jgi:hypothetical protein
VGLRVAFYLYCGDGLGELNCLREVKRISKRVHLLPFSWCFHGRLIGIPIAVSEESGVIPVDLAGNCGLFNNAKRDIYIYPLLRMNADNDPINKRRSS